MTASVGADHRVSDGHRGALFLAAIGDALQRPDELAKGAVMTRDELRATLHSLPASAASPPKSTSAASLPAVRLRDQVDLDSVDWLNFLVAVHAELGVDIPDAEAARLPTLDTLLDYCGARLGVA